MGDVTYKQSENRMADMTMKEIKERFMGIKFQNQRETIRTKKIKDDNTEECEPEDIPGTINWLEKGHVTPVKDQSGFNNSFNNSDISFQDSFVDYSSCGSCWAFSAVGAIEAAYKRAGHDLTSLSASDLVDCTENNGCYGGLPVQAFDRVLQKGIATEDDVPYTPREKDCETSITRNINISSYDRIEPATEDELKRIVGCKGPVSVLVCADENFINYATGIYDRSSDPDCTPNHAVLVVGYDEDYWLVKNSWGVGWGGEQVRKIQQAYMTKANLTT